ncbi:phage tail protein [Solirubrobacter ginsenosidimutans]|uniref:Phage tail protein n=1 Tax=Solirubrobacter ginsenosidimutans TaxID=490573 RepID=A0A9X3S7P2_9ACTN|nr:phage tail protein [Solirubrobacter ginsenosidimutans]MDA0166276.1 phage tail protein [Solirubrobacter ginsenosidimutans]
MPFRERPYSQFNFVVDFGTDPKSAQAGFQEVSGLGMEITVAEYRNGNEGDNTARKITGTYKVPDVTCKRGVIGDSTLYDWLNDVRNGSQEALRSVTIQLLSEDRATVAQTWKLTNARPIKYTGPQLSGKGTDVAIEELVLASERLEMEF